MLSYLDMSYQFHHATVAGTFDHLHAGHKALIDKAFAVAGRVSIGLVSGALLVAKAHASSMQPFTLRKKELEQYLKENGYDSRAEIFELTDIVGIALTDTTLDSIIVSTETRQNALKINSLRRKLGMKPLAINTIELVKSNIGKTIRSSLIRSGEIDRTGYQYKKQFTTLGILSLPPELRAQLRQPFGEVMEGSESDHSMSTDKTLHYLQTRKNAPVVIAIGDVVTGCLLQAGYIPDICIVDGMTQRGEYTSRGALQYAPTSEESMEEIMVKERKNGKVGEHKSSRAEAQKSAEKNSRSYINAPGTIQRPAVRALIGALKRAVDKQEKSTITVRGEEDLLALPAMLLAPLGSVILYGQFDLGIVVVEVTEELKGRVRNIITNFE